MYKRQIISYGKIVAVQIIVNGAGQSSARHIILLRKDPGSRQGTVSTDNYPVSYTHLDVYKRQHILQPVKDLFASRFFVSVGMMIDPAMMWEYAVPILILTLLVLSGQVDVYKRQFCRSVFRPQSALFRSRKHHKAGH